VTLLVSKPHDQDVHLFCIVVLSPQQVEHVIREEKFMQAYDLIEVYCELIVARMSIIDSQK
jgi:hypothetical protein